MINLLQVSQERGYEAWVWACDARNILEYQLQLENAILSHQEEPTDWTQHNIDHWAWILEKACDEANDGYRAYEAAEAEAERNSEAYRLGYL